MTVLISLGLSKMQLIYLFSKLKKRFGKVGLTKKEFVKQSALIKIGIISKERNKKSVKRFISVFRTFFANFFDIKYEFTYSELINELKKRKIRKELRERITCLVNDICSAKYSSEESMEKIKLEKMIKETKRVIKEL